MHNSIVMTSDYTFDLYDYQLEVVKKLMVLDRSLCSLDMGLGKTFVALALASVWEWDQLFIVCPKNKFRKFNDEDDSWENMVRKYLWRDFKVPKILTIEWLETSPIVVINYDMFKRLPFKAKPNTIFIFDEIQVAKTHTSTVGKAAMNLTRNAAKVVLLSGDPFPQGYKDSFNIKRILANEYFDWKQFKRTYYIYWIDDDGYPQHVDYKNTDQLNDFFHQRGVFLKTSDVLDLPPQIFIDVFYKSSKQLNEILDNGITKIGDLVVPAEIPIKKLTIARELSSGIYKLNDEWIHFDSAKLSKLEGIVHATSDNLIIFYNFVGEAISIKKHLTKLFDLPIFEINGQRNEKAQFLESSIKSILLCQYQAASSAIDGLQTKSSHLLCYSPTLSGQHWKQMLKRIHRIGQQKTCYYYLFQNKLEKKIYQSLHKFENYTLEVFEHESWN